MEQKLTARLEGWWRDNRVPALSALVFGLLAHAFMMLNKIPVDDDLPNMFNKGATTVSGRYGLELLRLVMPDWSMPWIYGLMSLAFLAAATCVIVRLFDIRSRALQILLPAVFVTFPAETGTMAYMFTAAPYALALLLTVEGVALFDRGGRGRRLAAVLLIAFSCSVYQGYFAFAASFCVILMIRRLVKTDESALSVLVYGLKLLGLLLCALAVYGLAILVASKALGLPLLSEAINEKQSLPLRVAVAYSAWFKTLTRGYFAYVNTAAARVLHGLLLLITAAALTLRVISRWTRGRWLLLCLCLFLFPLSCYCLYLLADNGYIHSLALYPFASLYVLCAVLLDGAELPSMRHAAALALIVAGNVYFANSYSLYAKLQYENTYALYTGMLARVTSRADFDGNTSLAILGERPALRCDVGGEFDFDRFQLPGVNITDTRQAENVIREYLGFDLSFTDEQTAAAIGQSAEFAAMPVYPYDGSVQKFGDVIVVKFGGAGDA